MATATVAAPRRFHLRVEDVALFLWLVLRPLVVPERPTGPTTAGYDPLGGLFDLVGLCAAAACLGARRADGTSSGLVANQTVAAAIGPLVGAVAFALDDCVRRLGLGGGFEILPLVLPVVAAVAARIWLPPTTALVRRALVTPFILAASGFFSDFLAGLSDLFDLRQISSWIANDTSGLAIFGTFLALAGVLVFYAMLVFAPRQIADREGGGLTWTIRFLVFIAGLTLGTTLAGIVHGT
jgi:hypothetical protein